MRAGERPPSSGMRFTSAGLVMVAVLERGQPPAGRPEGNWAGDPGVGYGALGIARVPG